MTFIRKKIFSSVSLLVLLVKRTISKDFSIKVWWYFSPYSRIKFDTRLPSPLVFTETFLPHDSTLDYLLTVIGPKLYPSIFFIVPTVLYSHSLEPYTHQSSR